MIDPILAGPSPAPAQAPAPSTSPDGIPFESLLAAMAGAVSDHAMDIDMPEESAHSEGEESERPETETTDPPAGPASHGDQIAAGRLGVMALVVVPEPGSQPKATEPIATTTPGATQGLQEPTPTVPTDLGGTTGGLDRPGIAQSTPDRAIQTTEPEPTTGPDQGADPSRLEPEVLDRPPRTIHLMDGATGRVLPNRHAQQSTPAVKPPTPQPSNPMVTDSTSDAAANGSTSTEEQPIVGEVAPSRQLGNSPMPIAPKLDRAPIVAKRPPLEPAARPGEIEPAHKLPMQPSTARLIPPMADLEPSEPLAPRIEQPASPAADSSAELGIAGRSGGAAGRVDSRPMAGTMAERIESWIKTNENAPPPRSITLRGSELHGLVIRVSVLTDGISIQLEGSKGDDVAWMRQVIQDMAARGLDVSEFSEYDSEGDRRQLWDEDAAQERRRNRPDFDPYLEELMA